MRSISEFCFTYIITFQGKKEREEAYAKKLAKKKADKKKKKTEL